MTFWYAIRAREDGKYLARLDEERNVMQFSSDRRQARRWRFEDGDVVRALAREIAIACDVVAVSDAAN